MSRKALISHLLAAVTSATVLVLIALGAFFTYLWRTSPDVPNMATGQVIRELWKGRLLYVRPWEDQTYYLTLRVFLALWAVAAVTGLAYWAYNRTRYGVSPDPPVWLGRVLAGVVVTAFFGAFLVLEVLR